MKKFKGTKALQKVTAILLSALIMLSAFAMMPADLFKVSAATTQERYELDFNNNWKFNLGNVADAQKKSFDDSAWETVELPHDFSISQDFFSSGTEAESGNLPGGTGWYRKMFSLPSSFNGKSIILNFDGAYKDTWVYVNGTLVGENHYGYNSFSFDISKYVTCNGKAANFIAVKVQNQLPSSRWYSGSGIYRDVTLTVADKLHVDLYGTYVTTPNLESTNGTDGTVNAQVTLTNSGVQKSVTVKTEILDASGAVVGTPATQDVTVNANTKTEVTLNPTLSNPNLWSSWDLGTPYLYTLRTTVLYNGTAIDVYDTEFGYRWINWDLDGGFSINGTNVKLEGVCLHHDQGVLGAAQTYDSIYRQVAILKDMGCNSIRTSHGTPSDVFMDVCNELGMLVMNEFFDGWDMAKNSNSNDFSVYFDQTINTSSNNILNAESGQMWYEFVLTQSVKRDRNDPSVVIWDVGNELAEGGGEGDFETIAGNMRTMLDALDSTRPVCQGNNKRNVTTGWPYNVEKYMTVTGGNYQSATWAGMYDDIAALTDAVTGEEGNPFVMSETSSAISTRGNYSSLSTGTYTCSAYDTTYVGWGESAASGLYNTHTNDWFSGTYTWTGFDYIGEPTNWNHTTGNYGVGSPSTSYFGIIDTAGFAKDTYYLYRSVWNSDSTTLHLVPGTWDSNELAKNGNYAYVAVYSNADHIELLGDGDVIATAESTTTTTAAGHQYKTWAETAEASDVNTTEFYTNTGKDLYAQFQVNYSNYDTISVKAYDENDNEITDTVGTNEISNVEATKIVASTWAPATQTYTADGDSYIYIEYEAQDANGNFDATYDGTINIEVQGDSAYIVGVDNGLQTDTKRFQQDSVFDGDTTKKTATVDMFNGRALVVLRSNTTVDDVEVVTTAADGKSVNGVTASVVAETGDELTDEFEEIADQSSTVYEPTISERLDAVVEGIADFGAALSPDSGEYTYEFYTARTDIGGATVAEMTSTDLNSFSDGWYILYGAGWSNIAQGAITHTTSGTGFQTDDADYSSTAPASTVDSWYFERQSNGSFYIYYNGSSNTKQYLQVTSSGLSVSTTPQELTVAISSSSQVTIGNGSGYYVNFSGSESNVASTWTDATNLKLYKVSYADAGSVENGEYVIYNLNYIMSGEAHSGGGVASISNSPSNDQIVTDVVNDYTFTYVEGSDNQYYVQNSEGLYLTIGASNSTASLSSTPATVTIYARDDGTVFIYNGGTQFLDNYRDGKFNSWTSTTSATETNRIMSLYSKSTYVGGGSIDSNTYSEYSASSTGAPVEDGTYVIYNNDSRYTGAPGILSGTIDSVGIQSVKDLPSDGIISTDKENAYTFTLVEGTTDEYYIQNSSGQYLTIGSSGGSISFSSTPTSVNVYGRSDGSINIYNADSSQFLDHYWNGSSQDHYSTWTSTTSATEVNRIFNLYKEENTESAIPEEKAALYEALVEGSSYDQSSYTNRSYLDLLETLEAGVVVLNDENADATAIDEATEAILNAIAALEVYRKTFPATIYKYGYNPNDADAPYSDGGYIFNEQTFASMKAIIESDENLVNQIKAIIGYDDDTIAWGDDTYKETALDEAIEKYAKFYSLSFTGAPVQGTSYSENFEKTAWNSWIKDDTQGADESNDEGASVQGLFSSTLVDGQPADHASYASLPYGNIASTNSMFNTGDGISFTYSIDDSTDNDVTIENLPALEDISVHINDMFKKEVVLVDENDESQGYSKYYWDLDFPVKTITNDFGVNTYIFDSADSSYLFQASYDDANNQATAEIVDVDDWSVELSGGKGDGNGFFPFNYQSGTTAYTGENAIYHYALTYSLDFHIPTSGTYADGEDIIFDFKGDDDVLVYVDGVLVLDNGGLHAARGASINFTQQSVSYQFAMDVTKGTVQDPNGYLEDDDTSNDGQVENSVTYTYGAANDGISADNLAALEKLHEVATNDGYHTLSFYFVERGSTESNFKVELNVQEISSNVQLENQSYAVDFGIPLSYDTTKNDLLSQEALDDGLEVQYLGITDGNIPVSEIFSFTEPTDVTQTYVNTSSQFDVNGMLYGDCTINADGEGVYTLNTTNFTGMDYFYNVAQVVNDPTYNEGVDYYIYERVRFMPATSIYFEDNFSDITYTNGTTTDGSGHGVWSTVGDASLFEDAYQYGESVDDVGVLPFGYDPAYDNCSTYSGYSAQVVTVSAANNPKNGGTSPTVKFSFTGTGFDVISLTDSTSGAFTVEVFDDENYTNKVGKSKIVNTYYGYGYGQLYADENGETTLTVTDKPMYKSEKGLVTTAVKYYTVDGTTVSSDVTYLDASGSGYTETPTYYDADGNLTTTETDTPAYAYAYAFGWVDNEDANSAGIYQVPVIKVEDLDYGKYYVKITPVYSSMQDVKGTGSYKLYIDAIRIYNPAGKDADPGTDIVNGYIYSNEGYPAYLKIKDMLIGADSLGVNDTQGVIFIDGIAALNNDLEMYKKAGPNNELYLASGQAVAFEVWATGIPDSVQIGASSAQGTATLGITYGDNTVEKVLNTSTDMNYSINSMLPVGGKLTWTRTVVDEVTYYKTDTIVVQNTSDTDSIMSVSNVKWNFTGVGQNGHFQVNDVPVEVALMSDGDTVNTAYAMLAPKAETPETDEVETPDTTPDVTPDVTPEVTPDVTPDNDAVEDVKPENNGNENNNSNGNTSTSNNSNTNTDKVELPDNMAVVNEPITVTVTTSTGVTELVIRDENGKVITPDEIDCAVKSINGKEVKIWTITLTESESGTYTYSVIGEFEDGTVEQEEDITIDVVTPEELSFFEKVAKFFESIAEFFKSLVSKI